MNPLKIALLYILGLVKPTAKPVRELPDYEQAILKSIKTEPNAWNVARHQIRSIDVVKCSHAIKGVTILANYPHQGMCGVTDLNFSPEFSEIFIDFAVTKLVKQEAEALEASRAYTASLIRKGLGL